MIRSTPGCYACAHPSQRRAHDVGCHRRGKKGLKTAAAQPNLDDDWWGTAVTKLEKNGASKAAQKKLAALVKKKDQAVRNCDWAA